ncbi:SDR family oxidoreductase [Sulfitobacter sp. HGT1]|jgi:NAD(P)-dependent dehydrogenase (short-subunit alcohol dehydrogenase family)|uniref:SDR family oxidoreductase n=1 Tax=Sulfitobacter sp. HGT1 TaxID=2735435 RepID=UPI001592B83C|nr:SDR family oxidoreductase [Sulfitobacter sp. HGT1]
MRPILLITGASAGIGAACARLAAPSYDLALNYRSDTTAAKAVAAQAEAQGARVLLCQGDVADPADVARIFDQIDQHFGRLDALINNAGIVDQIATVADMDHARLKRMFDVNVIGAMMVAQAAAARMQAQGNGAIVNMGSIAARLGSANEFVDYAASKAAIDAFTKGLANELAPQGIRVNAIRPGLIETEIHAKAGAPTRAQDLAKNIPMQRTGTADEVASATLFLLSDAASYITGTTLDVSGGR